MRIVEHTNLAYVEPHIVVIDGRNYLFFNEHQYFYVGNYRSVMIMKENVDALNKITQETGNSLTRLVNIAMKEFLDK